MEIFFSFDAQEMSKAGGETGKGDGELGGAI
jgi:hypothetical protein